MFFSSPVEELFAAIVLEAAGEKQGRLVFFGAIFPVDSGANRKGQVPTVFSLPFSALLALYNKTCHGAPYILE